MIILGIASVTKNCGVALIDGDKDLGHLLIPDGRGLSESLLPAVHTLMAEAGIGLSTLDGIAVSAGPGSFTGIKVGLAAAKGLAYTLSCGVVGISTLEALAWRVGPSRETIVPVIHSGRDQIFAGCYRVHEGTVEQNLPDRLTTLSELHAFAPSPSLLVGDAALEAHALLSNQEGMQAYLAKEQAIPLPLAIARLGLMKISAGHALTAATLKPAYLQRHEAEVRLDNQSAPLPAKSCSA